MNAMHKHISETTLDGVAMTRKVSIHNDHDQPLFEVTLLTATRSFMVDIRARYLDVLVAQKLANVILDLITGQDRA